MELTSLNPRRSGDVLVLVVIAVLGLIAAWVCFGLLDSEAQVSTPYSLGGAIAGAFVSWGVLLSVYLQLSRSSGETDALRARIEELQSKVIRGSPRPIGFEVEVDDHQGVVLARPGDWEPRGGTIFDFQSPESLDEHDPFPARFTALYVPTPESNGKGADPAAERDAYYEKLREGGFATDDSNMSYTTEIVHLGQPPEGAKSLRCVYQSYARITRAKDPFTERNTWQYQTVLRSEFQHHVHKSVDRGAEAALADRDAMERARLIAELRTHLVPRFVSELERGRCDPRDGLKVEVERFLRQDPEGASLLAAAQDRVAPQSAVPSGAGAAPGTEVMPSPATAARDVNAQPEPSLVDYEEVLPVSRMVVVCYHAEAGKIFFFELTDNAADYTKTSEIFNRILQSIRFLT